MHIPVQLQRYKWPRIARAGHRNEKDIYKLIEQLKEAFLFGRDKINVLKLSIALNTKQ